MASRFRWASLPEPKSPTRAVSFLARARTAAPTATGHTKRLLHESFHRDPRAMLEEVVRAQHDCLASWEIAEANQAWEERREAVFVRPPATS